MLPPLLSNAELAALPADLRADYLETFTDLCAGETLDAFIRRVSPHRPPPPHFKSLVEQLELARVDSEPRRVCVSMPPRHGKTTLLQHAFAWWLSRAPGDTCAYFSYNDTQGRSKSRVARALALQAGVRLADDSASTSEWRTTAGGGLLAGGAGGGLTGQGVSGLMVVDDPFKNREEADSDLTRDKVWEWFNEVVMTRLEGASVFVVHTRWHQDDLIARLEAQGDWTVINLPALAETDEAGGRRFGEALWPSHYPVEYLEALKKQIGDFSFSALYQGRPRPRGSKVFGTAHYYDPATIDLTGCEIIVGADPAASEKTTADYSAMVAMAVKGTDPASRVAYILEVYREQVTIPTFCNDLRAFQARHGDSPAWVEAVGVGKAVPQTILAVDPTARVEESETKGDKFQRAQGVAAAWNDGRVLVPLGSPPWLKAFLDEVGSFTGVHDAHDDQVDGLAHAWNNACKPVANYTGRRHHSPRRI